MNTLFKEYIIYKVLDILNDRLNEQKQLCPVNDSDFVYRNLTFEEKDFNNQITVNNKYFKQPLKLPCIKLSEKLFKGFLDKNIALQAEDGISSNVGSQFNQQKLDSQLETKLNKIIDQLNDHNITSNITQMYYQNDVKKYNRYNTFGVARFNVGYLRKKGIEVLRTGDKEKCKHVLIVSKKLDAEVTEYINKRLNGSQENINIGSEQQQLNIYNFLGNSILNDIKYSQNINNSYSLFFNAETGNIINHKKNDDEKELEITDLDNHCVFTNFFHRGYFANDSKNNRFNHTVYYNGTEFIIYKYDPQIDDHILYALQNNLTESFKTFLEHKGLLQQLYR